MSERDPSGSNRFGCPTLRPGEFERTPLVRVELHRVLAASKSEYANALIKFPGPLSGGRSKEAVKNYVAERFVVVMRSFRLYDAIKSGRARERKG